MDIGQYLFTVGATITVAFGLTMLLSKAAEANIPTVVRFVVVSGFLLLLVYIVRLA